MKKRVLSLLSSTTEVVYALGCEDQLVGRSHECDYPPAVMTLPICTKPKFNVDGSSIEVDGQVKSILQNALSVYYINEDLLKELKPDIILTQSQCEVCAVSEKDVKSVVKNITGINPDIISVEPNSVKDIFKDIKIIAEALNVVDKGADLIDFMKNRIRTLKKSYDVLNTNVYGHKNSKEQIVRIIAQWVSNPSLKGNCIGIHGSPGVGKTKLIKDGLCKALDLPFVFIPLGGVNDSAYLTGHSFTYEGAIHGKIVDSLMKANCMNPIIYFDELDKISDSARGQEIINTLIHLTDSTQNDSFFDKYFYDIPLDLSKSLIIFTYNNDDFINPILKDRMIRINTEDYTIKDKVNISKEFLIPELCKDFNFNNSDLVFTDNIIRYIVSKTDPENGVRNLKRSLECIISNINLYRLVNFNNSSNKTTRNNIKNDEFMISKLEIQYDTPFLVDNYIVDNLIKKKINPLSDSIAHIYI